MTKYTDGQRRVLLERGIVRALLAHMEHKGWSAWRTWDGEEAQYTLGDRAAVMAACFNLDEVSVRFAPKAKVAEYVKQRSRDGDARDPAAVKAAREACKNAEHGVLLVMGNGEDIISDWSYSEGDADRFNAAMEAFFAQDGEEYARDMVATGQRAAVDDDRIAVLAGPYLKDREPLAVIYRGSDGLRKVGDIPPCFKGSFAEAARVVLTKAGIEYDRLSVTMHDVDAYPGGWAKQALLVEPMQG
jgi:hypothetical protein